MNNDQQNKKVFVLDTNVLIHDYTALSSFEENDVVIPITVIEELDNLKSGTGIVPYSVRKALKKIWEIIGKGTFEGAPLPGGGTLSIKINKTSYFEEKNADHSIISCAIDLKNEDVKNVVFISKDTGARIKAMAMKVQSQDYERDKTSLFQKYGKVLKKGDYINGIESVRYLRDGNEICRLWGKDSTHPVRLRDLWGISPKNEEQICAMDALTSPDIKIVALTGKAGTGKTLLALSAALYQVTKTNPLFDSVLVARPPVPMGYEMGFLPGDLLEKIDPWMSPIYDNLDFLIKTFKDTSGNKEMQQKYKNYQYLIDQNLLEIMSLTHIRGRSLPRKYIIIDEGQNSRPLDAKTMVTRLGEGSKIVFTGDLDQIDTPYLDAESNGLAHLIAKAINETDFCYLDLQKSERSEVADRYAKIL